MAVMLTAAVVTSLVFYADGADRVGWRAAMESDQINVEAVAPGSAQTAADSSTTSTEPATEKFFRATPDLCQVLSLDSRGSAHSAYQVLASECADGTELPYGGIDCPDGQERVEALFRQTRTAAGGWSDPEIVAEEQCQSPVTAQDLATEAARAFAALTLTPGAVHVQPPDGWTLVNLGTITYTEDRPQEFATTLLGVPVTLRATPARYAWSFGDGTTVTTTDPGAPYPRHTVQHAYATPGTATITLTTTFAGHYRVAGSTDWLPVTGEASTTSSSGEITIHEATARLVEDLHP